MVRQELVFATISLVLLTASLPLYLKGAAIILNSEYVSWAVLTRHLRYIGAGLVCTTVPVVFWMAPRLLDQLGGLSALHAFLGLQAYALLLFGLTGIYHILRVKREANLYRDPDPEADISELHPDMDAWRGRLRVGVFGYVIFWVLAYVLGVARYLILYVL
jgi:hypothetical protein